MTIIIINGKLFFTISCLLKYRTRINICKSKLMLASSEKKVTQITLDGELMEQFSNFQ